MEISTIYTSQEGGCDDQDTQHECETETEQCGVDETQQCEETEQWLSEDNCRQRCEVKARRDAKDVLQNSDCFWAKEWRTWNDGLRKDIGRIHRNLGRSFFPDANVSDDAVSALKHFRCDDIVSMDVNFWRSPSRNLVRC